MTLITPEQIYYVPITHKYSKYALFVFVLKLLWNGLLCSNRRVLNPCSKINMQTKHKFIAKRWRIMFLYDPGPNAIGGF